MNRDEWVKQYEYKKRIKRYVGHFKKYLANDLNGKFIKLGRKTRDFSRGI